MDEELKRKNFLAWATASMILCIVACVGDMGMVFMSTQFYKGYNSISQPISRLGAMGSPIARFMSIWWIFIGLLLVFYAIAFGKSNASGNKWHTITAWLIACYAVFEQAGSGIFPGNRIAGHYTPVGIVHNSLGAIGVIALIIAPFVISRKYRHTEYTGMLWFLRMVSMTGIPLFVIFIFSHFSFHIMHWIIARHGLWQRLFISIYYLFLIVISIKHYTENRDPEPEMIFNLSQQP